MQRFSKGEATPTVVARFRKRNDAEAHLRALNRLNPSLHYEIVFDPPDPPTEEAIEAIFLYSSTPTPVPAEFVPSRWVWATAPERFLL